VTRPWISALLRAAVNAGWILLICAFAIWLLLRR